MRFGALRSAFYKLPNKISKKMIINRTNFFSQLDRIKTIIKHCQFISVDLEMSGLVKGENFRYSALDSMQLKYWKLKENVRSFLPLQLGLCGFTLRPDGQNIPKIEAYPMSFYLYPYSLHDNLDKIFKFEKDTMDFLLAQDFDFNKVFYDGVYYVSMEAERSLHASKGHSLLKRNLEMNAKVITPDMIAFRAMHEEKIQAFMENYACIGQTVNIAIKYVKAKSYMYLEKSIREKWPGMLEISYDSEFLKERTKMMIKRLDPSEPQKSEKSEVENKFEQKKKELELDEANIAGVRTVFDTIIQEKIPLIFHNGIYDLLQIYDKMIQTPPELYTTFCKEVTQHFDSIYDTKFILNSSALVFGQLVNQKSDLYSAFSSFKARYETSEPIIEIVKEGNEEFELKSHDAMSDAFMTGYVFLKCLALLNILKEFPNKELFQSRIGFFRNRLFNYGAKVPFMIDPPISEIPPKKIFSVMDHKIRSLDKKALEAYLKGKYGTIGLYENPLGFYFFFSNPADEAKLMELLNQEKGMIIENFGERNLLIAEKKIAGEPFDVRLNYDEEEVFEKPKNP